MMAGRDVRRDDLFRVQLDRGLMHFVVISNDAEGVKVRPIGWSWWWLRVLSNLILPRFHVRFGYARRPPHA